MGSQHQEENGKQAAETILTAVKMKFLALGLFALLLLSQGSCLPSPEPSPEPAPLIPWLGAALHSHRLPLLLCGQGGQGGADCSRGCHGLEAGLGHIAIVIVVKKKNYCWKLFKINKQIHI